MDSAYVIKKYLSENKHYHLDDEYQLYCITSYKLIVTGKVGGLDYKRSDIDNEK